MADPDTGALIIDTDIGGDADDALAVAIAAPSVPELALLITTDATTAEITAEAAGETAGGHGSGPDQRARLARHLLDRIARTTRAEHGVPVRVSTSADYAAFMSWLAARLDPKAGPGVPADGPKDVSP